MTVSSLYFAQLYNVSENLKRSSKKSPVSETPTHSVGQNSQSHNRLHLHPQQDELVHPDEDYLIELWNNTRNTGKLSNLKIYDLYTKLMCLDSQTIQSRRHSPLKEIQEKLKIDIKHLIENGVRNDELIVQSVMSRNMKMISKNIDTQILYLYPVMWIKRKIL